MIGCDFRARLLASKAADHIRRQAEIAAHRPRLQPTGMPLVFIDGDAGSGFPAWIYGAAERGPPMRIGRVVATRLAGVLRIDDLYLFHDLEPDRYLPAVVAYLRLEADLFGLSGIAYRGTPAG